jgi:hypothetical protein
MFSKYLATVICCFTKKRKQVKDTWIKESQNECPALTCLYFRNLVEFAFMHKKECGKECTLLWAQHKKPDTAPHALAKNVWTLTTCFLCSCCSSTLFKVFLAWVCSIVALRLKRRAWKELRQQKCCPKITFSYGLWAPWSCCSLTAGSLWLENSPPGWYVEKEHERNRLFRESIQKLQSLETRFSKKPLSLTEWVSSFCLSPTLKRPTDLNAFYFCIMSKNEDLRMICCLGVSKIDSWSAYVLQKNLSLSHRVDCSAPALHYLIWKILNSKSYLDVVMLEKWEEHGLMLRERVTKIPLAEEWVAQNRKP